MKNKRFLPYTLFLSFLCTLTSLKAMLYRADMPPQWNRKTQQLDTSYLLLEQEPTTSLNTGSKAGLAALQRYTLPKKQDPLLPALNFSDRSCLQPVQEIEEPLAAQVSTPLPTIDSEKTGKNQMLATVSIALQAKLLHVPLQPPSLGTKSSSQEKTQPFLPKLTQKPFENDATATKSCHQPTMLPPLAQEKLSSTRQKSVKYHQPKPKYAYRCPLLEKD